MKNLDNYKILPNSKKLFILPAMKFAMEVPRYPHLLTTHQEKRNKRALMIKPIKLAWILFKKWISNKHAILLEILWFNSR